MRIVPFIAETPAAALAQIHAQLGPEAVVLSVRPLPASGLSRLWQKSRAVEVLAGVAEEQETEVRSPKSEVEEGVGCRVASDEDITQHATRNTLHASRSAPLPPLHALPARPHVFIGPPGVGKTTLLCKWLASAILAEQRAVRLWRLDGFNANTAEVLNMYGEMFGVIVERFWPTPGAVQLVSGDSTISPPPRPRSRPRPRKESRFESVHGLGCEDKNENEDEGDLLLVDLPGVEMSEGEALSALKAQLAALPEPRVHLVLNAAYDTPILLEQVRIFAPLEPEDLSFTHLDEEERRQKLWAVASGTNCSLRFLSAGQKIPGEFKLAEEPQIFPCTTTL